MSTAVTQVAGAPKGGSANIPGLSPAQAMAADVTEVVSRVAEHRRWLKDYPAWWGLFLVSAALLSALSVGGRL